MNNVDWMDKVEYIYAFELGKPSDWEVCEVWCDGDLTGSVAILGRRVDHAQGLTRYFWVDWSWGTCPECDCWRTNDGDGHIEDEEMAEDIWSGEAETTIDDFHEYIDRHMCCAEELLNIWKTGE